MRTSPEKQTPPTPFDAGELLEHPYGIAIVIEPVIYLSSDMAVIKRSIHSPCWKYKVRWPMNPRGLGGLRYVTSNEVKVLSDDKKDDYYKEISKRVPGSNVYPGAFVRVTASGRCLKTRRKFARGCYGRVLFCDGNDSPDKHVSCSRWVVAVENEEAKWGYKPVTLIEREFEVYSPLEALALEAGPSI